MGSTGKRLPGPGGSGPGLPQHPHARERLMDRQEHVGNRIDHLRERQGDLAERLSGLTGDREGNAGLKARLEGRQERVGDRLERATERNENITERLNSGDYGPRRQRPRMAGDAVASQNAATGASTPGG